MTGRGTGGPGTRHPCGRGDGLPRAIIAKQHSKNVGPTAAPWIAPAVPTVSAVEVLVDQADTIAGVS
jgi:hypothetical protein